MRRLWLVPAILTASVIVPGCSVTSIATRRADAQTLFSALRANEQVYQRALEEGQAVLEETQKWLVSVDHNAVAAHREEAQGKISTVTNRYQQLHRRLAALDVSGDVRANVLDPILNQLEAEQKILSLVGELMSNSQLDRDRSIRLELENHPNPTNLFTPAIRRIREEYGVARQRLWRGQPLTA